MKIFVQWYDVELEWKKLKYKSYRDLQFLPILIKRLKDILIDFVSSLPILFNYKGGTYDSILMILDKFTKMVNKKPVKVTMDAVDLVEVIIDVVK